MRCLDCLQDKNASDFYVHKRTGPSDVCKPCSVAAHRIRRNDEAAYKALLIVRKDRRQKLGAPDHKACTHCHVNKLLTDFREHHGLYGRSSWCLTCEKDAEAARRQGPRREELLEKRREAWIANPRTAGQRQSAKDRSRVWYAANSARHSATMLAWRKANPEVFRAVQQRRRSRRKGALNTLTYEEWAEVVTTFNDACAYCLRPISGETLTMDHMIPISKGGSHTQENVVPACQPCNSGKYANSLFTML